MLKALLAAILLPLSVLAQTPMQMRVYTNIADMVAHASPKSVDKAVQVLGYWTPGDGGGGVLYATNLISATNVGTRFIPALDATQSYNRVLPDGTFNVKFYGAKGNGTTEDTARIQTALDAAAVTGGVVKFPAGNYLVTSGLTVTNDAVFIYGDGTLGTTITFAPGSSGLSCIKFTKGSNEMFRGGVYNLRIVKNNSRRSQGVELDDTSRIVIENVQVGLEGGGFDDGAGSIALWVRGRELLRVVGSDFTADKPLVFAQNVNRASALFIDIDATWVSESGLEAHGSGNKCITIEDGVNLTRVDFNDLYLAKGTGGIYWFDTSTTQTSYGLRIRNVAWEQSESASGWALYINHNYALQTLDVQNLGCAIEANAVFINNVWYSKLEGIVYGCALTTPKFTGLEFNNIQRLRLDNCQFTANSDLKAHGATLIDDGGYKVSTSSPVFDNATYVSSSFNSAITYREIQPGILTTDTYQSTINKLGGHLGIGTTANSSYTLNIQGQSYYSGNVFIGNGALTATNTGQVYSSDGQGGINLINGTNFVDIGAQGAPLDGGFLQSRHIGGLANWYLQPRGGKVKIGGYAGVPHEQYQVNAPTGATVFGAYSTNSPLLYWTQATASKFPYFDTSGLLTNSVYGPADITSKVASTRTINTTSPLTGGGDLSADRTIAMPAAATAQNGYLTSTDWNTFNGKVGPTRAINTTSPLAGGGDLSADRTISMPAAATAQNGYLTSTDWNTFNGKVASTRSISTTAPLTGGGDFSANRTFGITQSGVGTDGYLSTADWNTFNNKANPFTNSVTIALSNPSSAVTTGTLKNYWRSRYAGTIKEVDAIVLIASGSGSVTLDIKKNGTTILSAPVSISAGATNAVASLSVTSLAVGDVLTGDITAAGNAATRGVQLQVLFTTP